MAPKTVKSATLATELSTILSTSATAEDKRKQVREFVNKNYYDFISFIVPFADDLIAQNVGKVSPADIDTLNLNKRYNTLPVLVPKVSSTANYFKVNELYDLNKDKLAALKEDDLREILIRTRNLKDEIKTAKAKNQAYLQYKGFVINIKGVSDNNTELTFKRFLSIVSLYNIKTKQLTTSLGSLFDFTECAPIVDTKKHFVSSGMEYFMRMKLDGISTFFEDEDYQYIFAFTILVDYLAYQNTLKKQDPKAVPEKIEVYLLEKNLPKYASLTMMRNCGYGAVLMNWDTEFSSDEKTNIANILKQAKVRRTGEAQAVRFTKFMDEVLQWYVSP